MLYTRDISDKAERVLEKIEYEGYPLIVGPTKGRFLASLVDEKNPRRILEVGTNVGYSAITMAGSASDYTRIITIEIDPDTADEARDNIKAAGFEDRIKVRVGDAREITPTLSEKFDFMFIDAVKNQYFDYLKLAEDKLDKGAYVVSDNVGLFKDSMTNFLDYLRKSGKYKSKTYEFGSDAMEVSIKE
jgi:predicted O-methyltransferase YrrM